MNDEGRTRNEKLLVHPSSFRVHRSLRASVVNYRVPYTQLKIALILLSCFGLISCEPRRAEQGKRYEVKGKVVSVDKSKRQITLDHEEVKGFMAAMVMPFSVKDEWALEVMAPGDQVSATLVVVSDSSWLENVVVTKTGAEVPGVNKTEGVREPQPGDEVPTFTLINQDGKRINTKQYPGKILLLTFIYTRCPLPEYCTLMSNNFAEIEKEVQNDFNLQKFIHLLSITIDPEYDTPKVLRSYGAAHTGKYREETFDHWEFATGTPREIKDIAHFFGLTYHQESDQIIHSLRTAIIGPDGKVFKIYRGNEWKPDEVIRDLRELSRNLPS